MLGCRCSGEILKKKKGARCAPFGKARRPLLKSAGNRIDVYFTVWVIGPAIPAELLASPEYTPRMAWLPAPSELVVQVAVPFETGTAAQSPIVESFAVNFIEPVGGALCVMTRAVNVTDWPAEMV